MIRNSLLQGKNTCPGQDRSLVKVASELSPYFNFLSQIFACTSTNSRSGTSQAVPWDPQTSMPCLSACFQLNLSSVEEMVL